MQLKEEQRGEKMIFMQKLRGAMGGSSLRGRSGVSASLALIIVLLVLPQGSWATSADWLGTTTNYNLTTNWVGTPATVPGRGGG